MAAVSRWFEASSNNKTLTGRNTKAANATRAFSPPLSSPMRRGCHSRGVSDWLHGPHTGHTGCHKLNRVLKR
jgi:hypothetical protein